MSAADTPRWVADEVDRLVAADDYAELVMLVDTFARVAARNLIAGDGERAAEFAAAFGYADAGIKRLFAARDAKGRAS